MGFSVSISREKWRDNIVSFIWKAPMDGLLFPFVSPFVAFIPLGYNIYWMIDYI